MIFDNLTTFLFEQPTILTRFIETAVILILLTLIRKFVLMRVTQTLEDPGKIYAWRKGSQYVVLFLMLVTFSAIWFEGFDNASTYLGLLSAGIAITMQDPLINIVGWIYILARHPFEVGDRIEIGDVGGDVIDIEILRFTLLEIGNWVDAEQSTGRVIHVPNRMVFNHHLANYTSGVPYIWNEIPILLTFESDWEKAKRLLHSIIEKYSLQPSMEEKINIQTAAKKSNVRYPKLTPVVYTKVSGSGVVLTLRYLCKPRSRRNSEQSIWEEVLRLFAEQKDLDFAYNTQRIFYHPVEGKTLLTDHSEVSLPKNHLVNG
ncbi:MAG: mechanosensitive ion channel domain-containing protein, partial [Chloroflexota bacterium]